MCLAVPGRIVAITSELPAGAQRDLPPPDPDLWRMATVDFGGVRQSVSLACLSEACLGDLVLVHVGLAICRVEEALEEGRREPKHQLSVPPVAEPNTGPIASARVGLRTDRSGTLAMRSPLASSEPVPLPSPHPPRVPAGVDRNEGQP